MAHVHPHLHVIALPPLPAGEVVIWDCFMMNNELDMLECRLTELESIPNLKHVLVEADVDHQDHPKPLHYEENRDRFAMWADRIVHVVARELPTAEDDPDPWAREHAQREWFRVGLADAGRDDIVLQSDIDEIPTTVAARNVRPRGFVAFEQRGHFWSLRWQYPHTWQGTVAGRLRDITSFGQMRDLRNLTPVRIPNAGWHLSWLPNGDTTSADAAVRKVGSYCHPEVTDRILNGLASERFLSDGVHVDGVQMVRCEIDHTFPKWIRDGHCPKSWLQ